MFPLLCTALHPCIPALEPGSVVSLARSVGGGITVHVTMTARVAAMLITAIRDGALVPTGPRDEFWDEIEREIMATRDELLARADHLLLNAPVPALLHAS